MDLVSRLETAAWHLDQAMKPAMAETVREALEQIAGNCISPGTVASRVLAKE